MEETLLQYGALGLGVLALTYAVIRLFNLLIEEMESAKEEAKQALKIIQENTQSNERLTLAINEMLRKRGE